MKIPFDEFKAEHERLKRVLRRGSKKERKKEADEQEEELKEETPALDKFKKKFGEKK
jgi:hypothetical protein